MSATGLSTAEIVISINKNKSHSSSQNNKPPWRILQLDSIHKERASVPLEVGREWHLLCAGVSPEDQEGGESRAGVAAAEIGQVDLTSCIFS